MSASDTTGPSRPRSRDGSPAMEPATPTQPSGTLADAIDSQGAERDGGGAASGAGSSDQASKGAAMPAPSPALDDLPMDTSISLPKRRARGGSASSSSPEHRARRGANARPREGSTASQVSDRSGGAATRKQPAHAKSSAQAEQTPRNDEWLESFLQESTADGPSGDAPAEPEEGDGAVELASEAEQPAAGKDVADDAVADPAEPAADSAEAHDDPAASGEPASEAAEQLRRVLEPPGSPASRRKVIASDQAGAEADADESLDPPAADDAVPRPPPAEGSTSAPASHRSSLLSSVFDEDEEDASRSRAGIGGAGDSTAADATERDDDEEPEPALKFSALQGGAADVLKKDTASALAVSGRFLALGTHAGMIYILDVEGNLVKGFRSHTASILALDIDSSEEFVASAGMDGLVSISALSTSEQYVFDFRRPMRCVALEPNFGRRSTRTFVCGGMAGSLLQREKSWFGHKEVVLHAGEGPIWNVQWKGTLIAWANDRGVRIYDTATKQRITFITPPSPDVRADMHRCSLVWKDARTLLVAWADHIKIARVKEKPKPPAGQAPVAALAAATSTAPQLFVEMAAIYQLDTPISGIAPYGNELLVLAHVTAEDSGSDEGDDDGRFRRKEALPPELRLINGEGEELSSDVLALDNCARFQCNDYLLVPAADAVSARDPEQRLFYVVTPGKIFLARPRTRKDHIDWLLERRHYAQALGEIEAMGSKQAAALGFDSNEIGRTYLKHLVETGSFQRAARLAGRILGRNAKAWEDWIFLFVERGEFDSIIPFIPVEDPTLSNIVYDMVLAHYLRIGSEKLLDCVNAWPPHIYSTQAVVRAIEDKLEQEPSSRLLMEGISSIYLANRQPGKALPYYLRLRKPDVFELILEHSLFSDVRDQALQLVEFDEDVAGKEAGTAIQLLVDHTYSIPVSRVVPQLEPSPRHLHLYLDALFRRDYQSVTDYADRQVALYSEYRPEALMPFLRAMSSYYDIEKAYQVCKAEDLVPEMVFLLGRVGDNKRALTLIIERLADVERAIDFAKEQNDDDLWEDLLKYSETRPAFIRGLLENVGAEIDPLRLIRRIKDGLAIPGLKPALIKILQEFNLQVSLLDGSAAILYHDGKAFSQELRRAQRDGLHGHSEAPCSKCGKSLYSNVILQSRDSAAQLPTVFFLCRHVFHLGCLVDAARVPKRQVQALSLPLSVTQAGPDLEQLVGPQRRKAAQAAAFDSKLRYEARLRVVLRKGCPACSTPT